jgi:hypothetical protein
MPSIGVCLQHLAGVGGGQRRRCEGRTTPSPTPRCCSSSCSGGTTPSATPIPRTSGLRRAPPNALASRSLRRCAAPHGTSGPKGPSSQESPGTHRRRRRRWSPAKSHWGEVVKLHLIVVAQPAHKAARRRGEAALVMPEEADDVAVRRVGLPVRRRWNDPRRGSPLHVWRQLTAIHELVQGELRHCRPSPWQGI